MNATIYVDRVATPPRSPISDPRSTKWSNGQHKTRNSYPAAGGTRPLSNEQKARLCILAKQAFDVSHSSLDLSPSACEAWRREQQHQVTGHASLTTCTQADYLPLVFHFAHLAGEDGVAVKAHVQDSTSDRRIALHKLDAECELRGLTLAYPAAIARTKYKSPIEQCTAKQLWQLVFHVRKSKHKPLGGPRSREAGDAADAPERATPHDDAKPSSLGGENQPDCPF